MIFSASTSSTAAACLVRYFLQARHISNTINTQGTGKCSFFPANYAQVDVLCKSRCFRWHFSSVVIPAQVGDHFRSQIPDNLATRLEINFANNLFFCMCMKLFLYFMICLFFFARHGGLVVSMFYKHLQHWWFSTLPWVCRVCMFSPWPGGFLWVLQFLPSVQRLVM